MSGEGWVIRNDLQAKWFLRRLEALRASGEAVYATVRHYTPPKSTAQLRALHAIFSDVSLALVEKGIDCTPDQVKMDAKREYGVVIFRPNLMTGQRQPHLKSLADYDRSEATYLINSLIAWAAEEHGIDLDPELYRIKEASRRRASNEGVG